MVDIVELYVILDDFCKQFMPRYLKLLKKHGLKSRNRECKLSLSEILLIVLLFPHSGYKCFKWYYINQVQGEYKSYFQMLPSYNRFVELMPRSMPVLLRFLGYLMYKARAHGHKLAYVDSTHIAVCHNKRISANRVFKGTAALGKSSIGWFFGFKLHIMCDLNGNLTSLTITKGNTDDRTPVLSLAKGFVGKLFADKGYISKKLTAQLNDLGIALVTGMKKNMQAFPAHLIDVVLSKKRAVIESVFNILKNKLQMCHTRHRSTRNFIVHLLSVLVGYQLLENKPKINLAGLNLLEI